MLAWPHRSALGQHWPCTCLWKIGNRLMSWRCSLLALGGSATGVLITDKSHGPGCDGQESARVTGRKPVLIFRFALGTFGLIWITRELWREPKGPAALCASGERATN